MRLTRPRQGSILPDCGHEAESSVGGEGFALGAWLNVGPSSAESLLETATESIGWSGFIYSMEPP